MTRYLFIAVIMLFISANTFGQEISEQDSLKENFFPMVDKSATFPKGIPKFYDYIDKNIKIPDSARKNKKSGKVYVEFVINKDGSIDPELVRALSADDLIKSGSTASITDLLDDEECKAEAIRLLKESPMWIPAKQNGKVVRQRMVIPIMFRL